MVNIITKKPELQQRGTVSVNGTSFNGGARRSMSPDRSRTASPIALSATIRTPTTGAIRGTVIDTRTGKPVNVPRERRLDEPYNITRGSTDLVSANIEHALNESWKIRIGGLYNHNWYKDNQARVEF